MPLTVRQATDVAHKWVRQQEGFPRERMVMCKQYQPDICARRFEVFYTIAGYTSSFLVMRFNVLDNGTVEIKKDGRDYIRQFMADRGISEDDQSGRRGLHHSEAVKIFFSAFEGETAPRPKWFIELWARLDTGPNKPHAHAHIFAREENDLKSFAKKEIFVKIAASRWRKQLFLKHMPREYSDRTVVVLVKPHQTNLQIQEAFFNAVREKFGKRLLRK